MKLLEESGIIGEIPQKTGRATAGPRFGIEYAMISKKYLVDYRVVETVDDKGKIRAEAVYIGGDYVVEPPVAVRDRWLILGLSALSWVAFIGALLPVTDAAQIAYVMLPYVACMVTMYLMTGAAIMFVREKEIMTREKAEKISKRVLYGTLLTAVLSGASFIALTVTIITSDSEFPANDILFDALLLVIAAASGVAFSRCRKIKAVKIADSESDLPAVSD